MKQTFTANIFFLVLINLLIKPFYVLVIDVGVQNSLGTSEYGLFFALFNFCFLFQIIGDLGIQNYNSQYISKNRNHSKEILPKLIGLKLLLGFAFIVIAAIFFFVLGYDSAYLGLFIWIAINQILMSFILYLRGNLAALGHYALNSILSVIDKLILIFILGYLLWFSSSPSSFTLYHFVYAHTFALTITLFLAFISHHSRERISFPKFNKAFSKDLIKKSFPYATIILLMTAYTRMDAIMLERLLDDNAYSAGIYAAAYRLLDAANMFAFLFAGLLLPMFANIIKEKKLLEELCFSSLKLILAGAIPLVVFVLFFDNEIVSYLYKDTNEHFSKTLSLLFPSFLAIAIGYIFGTLLTAGEHIRKLNLYFFIGILLNFSLNLYLIPRYQSEGAAIATLITQIFVCLMQVYLVFKIFSFDKKWNIVLATISYAGISYLTFNVLKTQVELSWMVSFLIAMIILFPISMLLKLVDIKDLLNFTRK